MTESSTVLCDVTSGNAACIPEVLIVEKPLVLCADGDVDPESACRMDGGNSSFSSDPREKERHCS
jgi:hypothetical protein